MLRELIRLTVRRVLWHLSPTRRDEAIQLAINHIVPTKFVVRMKKTSSGWTVKPEGLSDITVKQDGHIERNHIGNFSAATRYNGRILTKKLMRKISEKVKAVWTLKRMATSMTN